eukprot:TRINITY_DN66973_c4_g1_i1.p2 TRINITY_DN66973_c4_g1~~TRINITY_DN66973_c4_g1_i1.p2  ORF type:complete len:329 (-),score=193.45 TRINITY_DN66973_c4_g1_i1:646-1632(-)
MSGGGYQQLEGGSAYPNMPPQQNMTYNNQTPQYGQPQQNVYGQQPPQYGQQQQVYGQPQQYPPQQQQQQQYPPQQQQQQQQQYQPRMGPVTQQFAAAIDVLSVLDFVYVKQKIELAEVVCNWEGNNEYTVFNRHRQPLFKAKEDTDCCTRQVCGSSRPFDIWITDTQQRPVLHLERPLRCCCSCFIGCCRCCAQELRVKDSARNDQPIGAIVQKFACCKPKFDIRDEMDNTLYRLVGPCCNCSLCGNDVEFNILNPLDDDDAEPVAKISKKWSGIVQEAFTDADNFGVTLPMDMPTSHKTLLLSSVFLVDFMYFEDSQAQKGNSGQHY